jgi:hypothetical protein
MTAFTFMRSLPGRDETRKNKVMASGLARGRAGRAVGAHKVSARCQFAIASGVYLGTAIKIALSFARSPTHTVSPAGSMAVGCLRPSSKVVTIA